MPKGLDNLQKKIWKEIQGKINPKTKKPYTESESWAIATARWKATGKTMSVFSEGSQQVSEPELVMKAIIGGS